MRGATLDLLPVASPHVGHERSVFASWSYLSVQDRSLKAEKPDRLAWLYPYFKTEHFPIGKQEESETVKKVQPVLYFILSRA